MGKALLMAASLAGMALVMSCGDDGCGGSCGDCEPGYACDEAGLCV
ncbi:MAG: hypothetical protein ISR64_05100 [Deltaproteobacteria bacterium]|nr:hypothetical protein [Deltaproteobacteria bacterium]